MNIVQLSQLGGVFGILILFGLWFYLAVKPKAFQKSGRFALLWTSVWGFSLFGLRALALLDVGDASGRTIVSGLSTIVLLFAVLFHLFLVTHEEEA